jgi:hypothetical protein
MVGLMIMIAWVFMVLQAEQPLIVCVVRACMDS